jgi:hypothetical protein
MSEFVPYVAKSLLASTVIGVVVTVAFTVIASGAILMTGGDGSAPAVTHLMQRLIDIPVKLLGLSFEGSAGTAGVFWGAVSALVVLLIRLVLLPFRGKC